MRAPVKSAYVVRFFQLVTLKQLTEAERELMRIKEKIERTEWNHGYYRALQGMLLARRGNSDQNVTFLASIDVNNRRALLEFRREFQEKVESRLYTDYDRGFFSAWADYVGVLRRIDFKSISKPLHTPKPEQPTQPQESVEEKTAETQASLVSWQGQVD